MRLVIHHLLSVLLVGLLCVHAAQVLPLRKVASPDGGGILRREMIKRGLADPARDSSHKARRGTGDRLKPIVERYYPEYDKHQVVKRQAAIPPLQPPSSRSHRRGARHHRIAERHGGVFLGGDTSEDAGAPSTTSAPVSTLPVISNLPASTSSGQEPLDLFGIMGFQEAAGVSSANNPASSAASAASSGANPSASVNPSTSTNPSGSQTQSGPAPSGTDTDVPLELSIYGITYLVDVVLGDNGKKASVVVSGFSDIHGS